MDRVFTKFIRVLADGAEPDVELAAAVREKLRGGVIRELHKRGLWDAPPGYLGVHSSPHWSEGDALEELTDDVLVYNLRRVQGMKAQLEVRDNVEGMWFLNIRNFFSQAQKRHDPIGFRCFLLAEMACRQLIGEGTLHILEGDNTDRNEIKIRNETVLSFAPDGEAEVTGEVALDEIARIWSGELLPELITARGKNKIEVAVRLRARIAQLPNIGIEVFRFKDLLDPLKNEARDRWRAIGMQDGGEVAIEEADPDQEHPRLVRLIRPDSGFEEREAFEKLLPCVEEILDRLEGSEKTRTYLQRFWDFLRAYAAEDTAELPARRKISKILEIPRGQFKNLESMLGDFIEECQRTLARAV